MPKPESNETEKDFLKRCIPELIKEEGYEQKQAVAICYSIYRKEGTEEKSPKPEKKNPNNTNNKVNLSYSPRTKRRIYINHMMEL